MKRPIEKTARHIIALAGCLWIGATWVASGQQPASSAVKSPAPSRIGREAAVAVHLQDGQEFSTPLEGCSRTAACCLPRTGPSRKAAAVR